MKVSPTARHEVLRQLRHAHWAVAPAEVVAVPRAEAQLLTRDAVRCEDVELPKTLFGDCAKITGEGKRAVAGAV